jgi:hypothetical protein
MAAFDPASIENQGAKYSPGIYWQDDLGKIFVIKADITSDLTDERTAEITDHPIESGAVVSDHVIHKPDTLTLQLLQTQTPIEDGAELSSTKVKLDVRENQFEAGGLLALSRAVGAAISAIGSLFGFGGSPGVEVYVLTAATELDRIVDLHTKLIEAKQKARSIQVSFLGYSWEGMLITNVKYMRSNKDQAGRFTLELRQIRTVSTASTKLPNPQDLIMKPPANSGSQAGDVLKDAEEKNSTKGGVLKNLSDAAGVTVAGDGL